MLGIQSTGLYKLTTDSNRDLNFFYISYQNFEGNGNKKQKIKTHLMINVQKIVLQRLKKPFSLQT